MKKGSAINEADNEGSSLEIDTSSEGTDSNKRTSSSSDKVNTINCKSTKNSQTNGKKS